MDSDIPICIIYINADLSISKINELLMLELSEIGISGRDMRGDIRQFLPDASVENIRTKSILTFGTKQMSCLVSFYKNCFIIEHLSFTKSFIRFLGHELKTLVSASIDLTGFMSNTLLTQQQKKYIEPIKRNNLVFLKTINNTLDYIKLANGIHPVISFEDFPVSRLLANVKDNISSNVTYTLSRDVILTSDYRRLSEMVIHILSFQADKTKKVSYTIKTSLEKDIFSIFFTDLSGKLSKYQRDTIFQGFIHNVIKSNYESLTLPIARGLAILCGGELKVISNSNSTTFIFSIKTKDFDSD